MDSLATLLVLADGRLPAGGHAHSGGVEAAVAAGRVRDLDGLDAFLRGRLATSGRVAAAFAAAACAGRPVRALDDALDARTASPALRRASRAQGRALLRAARTVWPAPPPDPAGRGDPHHAVALGVVARAAGLSPHAAALAAAYGTVTGCAGAAVRLLGLDPFAVNAAVVALRPALVAVVDEAVVARPADQLPAPGAPVLDLMAQAHVHHHREQVRLFVS